MLDVVHPVQSPSPFTQLGAKGIAEGNQHSTPVCIANAVADALGRADVTIPLKPSKVLEWIIGPELASQRQPVPLDEERRRLTGRGKTMVRQTPERVWQALLDEDVLKVAIPGCESLVRVAENKYKAIAVLGVGPVRGRFEADVQLSDLKPPASALLSVKLIGPLGTASGVGRLQMSPEPQGCSIAYEYQLYIAGRVAMVGGRLIDATAKHLISEFFRRFANALGGGGSKSAGLLSWIRIVVRRFFGGRP